MPWHRNKSIEARPSEMFDVAVEYWCRGKPKVAISRGLTVRLEAAEVALSSSDSSIGHGIHRLLSSRLVVTK
jgi:hypothetical protein